MKPSQATLRWKYRLTGGAPWAAAHGKPSTRVLVAEAAPEPRHTTMAPDPCVSLERWHVLGLTWLPVSGGGTGVRFSLHQVFTDVSLTGWGGNNKYLLLQVLRRKKAINRE